MIQKLDAALEKDARLQFIVEEFLKSEQGDYVIPNDYKFYMFNGEIACIQVINRLSPNQGFTTCYDEHWNQIERINTYYPEGEYQEPPACLNEMIGYAKTLSQAYGIFVRIDFYATDKGACFGEFTPTPFMGKGFTPASEKMLVDYWDKYCPGMV
ncbi:ATP-grasp fold amidoligase family protein [Pontibacter sp. MBLB2868]|uniref:ATP-grasp fold amidoligase family protein n=1 Tax=Pontibacter sp. MBLB2868 TaxID=3451555 RepID=UPI003F74E58E